MTGSIRSNDDAEALILGLGMYATGGGGLASRGRNYMTALREDGIEVSWSSIDEVPGDTLTCSVYGMGSIAPHPPMSRSERQAFGVDEERHPHPWLRAVDQLEQHLARRIGAIVPFELGPSNTLVAVDAAARSGRTLIDGDYIGRALPEMSQALPAILGLPTWPLAICDPWGNALIMTDCPSPLVAERVGKMVSRVTKAVDMGASCSHAAFPLMASQAKEAMVTGTLSECLTVGRRVLAAREADAAPITAAIEAVGGRLLFEGVVVDRTWRDSPDGYMDGTTEIAGSGLYRNRQAAVWFRNEHHLVRIDGQPAAMSPDIVAIVDAGDAEPISNTELDVDRQVAVIGIPARTPFRSGAALAATEPRHYGIDIEYRPLSADG
ncbi:MAG: DUF917 domain-containing protein [Acidimicrobiia bacterium]